MREDIDPVQWVGQQAVVALPVLMDASNAGQVREELLSVINSGATALIADMTTTSCNHAGADAVVRAFQRAVISGTKLRLVVTAEHVSRVLSLSGLDHLVPMCGPLCDVVLDLPRSAAVLADLARSNVLLVPLDQRREWYRYHHLFRDMLLAELERREPGLMPVLRRRAASWCLDNGRPEEALEYCMAAGTSMGPPT